MQVLMTVSKQSQDGTWLFKKKSITMRGGMNIKCVEDVFEKTKVPVQFYTLVVTISFAFVIWALC